MTTTQRWQVRATVGVMVLLVLMGCASTDGAESGGARADAGAEQGEDATVQGGELDEAGGSAATGTLTAASEAGRSIVSTADLTIGVDEVSGAARRAVVATEAVGGFIHGEQSDYAGQPRSELTFKVPPAEFAGLLARMADLGRPISQQIMTDDVTEQVVDLESRIATAEASVERMRGFLARAGTIDELARLEGELVQRETDLERLEGRRRTVEEQIEMATVVLTLVADRSHDEADALPGFFDGLRGGWGAFKDAGTLGLAAVGASMPWVVPFGVVATSIWWFRRRVQPG